MKIAIVEDQKPDRDRLLKGVKEWAEDHSVSLVPPPVVYDSAEALFRDFSYGSFDVLFLDIYMEGMNGMEAARQIRKIDGLCRLIFVTTTTEFAVESYEVDSTWYLVKPYTKEKLGEALRRCQTDSLEKAEAVMVQGELGEERLFLHEVAYTEYIGRKIHVYFKNGRESSLKMRQMDFAEILLKYPFFCDCMKGILVNFEAVKKLTENSFLLETGNVVPISRLKYKEVREQFMEWSYARMRRKKR